MDMLLELTEIELIAAMDIDGRTIAYTLIDEDYGYWQGWTEISGPVLRERTRMARMDGRQWDRVIRTPINSREKKAQEANKNLLGSDMFISACLACEIEPTKRQASKYRHKYGMVYRHLNV